MSEELTEVSEFSAAVVVPSTGENVTAESVRVPLQSLTNRSLHSSDRLDELEPGEVGFRRFGVKNASVPGNATTTLLTIQGWPANRSVGRLVCRLTSVANPGVSPHYGMQTWEFACRRDNGGTLQVRSENVIDDTSSSASIEHDIVLSDQAGNLRVSVLAAASNVPCTADLVVEVHDGPTYEIL